LRQGSARWCNEEANATANREGASITPKLFDLALHRRHDTRWFEDFALGERFILPSRTMTEALKPITLGELAAMDEGEP
jgi:hypothetical protein